jgi:flavin-dependent dehydrogenase
MVWECALGACWKIGDTLPPAAKPLLRLLGIEAGFETDGHLPSYGNLSAWGSSRLSSTDFIFHPAGNGWQLDRKRFDERLATAAVEAGATLEYGTRFVSARQSSNNWIVCGACGTFLVNITPRWLVDASGRKAIVARHLRAKRRAEHNLIGVYGVGEVANSAVSAAVDTRTLVESTPDGWWYTCALPDNRCVVTWLCDSHELRKQSCRSAQWFWDRINSTVYVRKHLDRLGYRLIDGPRFTAAGGARTLPCGGSAWLAVGDAACSFDPLSSQGILHALETGIGAGRVVAEALEGNVELLEGYHTLLNEKWGAYEKARRAYYRLESRWTNSTFWKRRRTEDFASSSSGADFMG